MSVIAGIDPGYGRTGYGVISVSGPELSYITAGCIETDSAQSLEARLQEIYNDLTDIINSHKPIRVGIEQLYFAKNTTTAMDVAQARGVVLLACANAGAPVVSISPPSVKQAVTGSGNADKQQVQMMVKTLLKLAEIPRPDDAADALAVAIATASTTTSY